MARVSTSLPGISVLLVVAFLSGSLASLETVSRETFRGTYAELDSDFLGSENGRVDLTYANVSQALRSVPGVAKVEPLVHVGPNDGLRSWDAPKGFMSPLVAVNGSFFATLRGLPLDGREPGDEPAAVVHRGVAQTLGLTLGSIFYYQNSYFNASKGELDTVFLNLTVVGLYGDPLSPREIRDSGFGPGYEASVDVSTYVSLAFMDDVRAALRVAPGSTNFGYYRIWAGRSLLDFSNLERTEFDLARLETRLKAAARPFALFISNEVRPLLASVEQALAEQQGVFLATGAPLIAFSIVLTFLAHELSARSRVYELAVAKARGADDRQLSLRVALGSAAAGLVGGAGGLLLGALLGSLIVGGPLGVSIPLWPIGIFLVGLGVGISLLASIGPLRSLRRISLARGLVDPRSALEWSPVAPAKVLWGAVLASGILALAFASFFTPAGIRTETVSTMFVFFGPMLALSLVVHAVSMRIRGWQRATAALLAPLAGPSRLPFLGGIAVAGKRSGTLTIAMTLGLSFAILIGIAQTSQSGYDLRFTQAEIGADIVVEIPGGVNAITGASDPNLAANLTAWAMNLSAVEGVAAVASAARLLGDQPILAIDAANFSAATYVSEANFVEGSLEDLRGLALGPRMVVTEAFADYTGLVPGDVFRVSLSHTGLWGTNQTTYDFTVAAIVTFLPGVGNNPNLIAAAPNETYIDFRSLRPDLLTDHLFHSGGIEYFVAVTPGFRPREVADRIASLGLSATFEVAEEAFEERRSDPMQVGISKLLFAQALYASVLLGAGVAMVMGFAHWDRRLEFGTMIARGCTTSDVLRLTLADALVPCLQALLIGIPLGYVGALLLELWALPSHPLVPRSVVVETSSVAPFLALVALVVLFTTLAASLAARWTVRESLRVRVI